MRFSKITILLACVLYAPLAHAAGESSMSHKVLSNTPQNSTAIQAPLYNAQPAGSSGVRFLSRTTHQEEFDTDFKNAPDPDMTSGNDQRVWDKYKDLAAGLEKPDTPELEKVAPEPTEEIRPQTTPATAPRAATGIGGILEQYYANKESRTKLRVLRVNTPKKNDEKNPEAEKN